MNIAEVIINTEVRSLDRVYHYVVPENIEAAVGMRVSVPFGFGNRTEIGYIVGFTESSPFENLKAIKKLIDKEPIISEKGIELARYLRRTCLCPMSEAFKLLLPPRVNFKFEKIVSLCDGDADGLTLSQKKIYDTLKAIGGTAEYKKLLESCGLKSSAALTALKNKGLVSVTEKAVGGNKEKIRKRVSLAVSKEEAAQAEGLGKAMQKVLDLLMEYDSMLLSELIDFANCSATSVKALESRGLVITEDVAVLRSPIKADIKEKESLPPTDEQKNAIDTLKKAIDFGEKSEYLLFGVTGSGKTEVFLQAVDYCISRGKNAIVLVPEISLTPQMTRRFAERFGGKVAVLHSGLSLGERYDEWNRIRHGEVNVAVGARSAISASTAASCCAMRSRSAAVPIMSAAASSVVAAEAVAAGICISTSSAFCSCSIRADTASDSSSAGTCERVISTTPIFCSVRRKSSASPLKSTKLYLVISVTIFRLLC